MDWRSSAAGLLSMPMATQVGPCVGRGWGGEAKPGGGGVYHTGLQGHGRQVALFDYGLEEVSSWVADYVHEFRTWQVCSQSRGLNKAGSRWPGAKHILLRPVPHVPMT